MKHVALLRAINVGGKNMLPMKALAEIFTNLGCRDVVTYIQSGNVVFSADETDTALLAASIEGAIADALAVTPRVVVLSRAELAQVARDNPYAAETNPKAVHVVFSGQEPEPAVTDAVAAAQQQVALQGSRDEAQFVGRVLFLHTPDGYGRSDLAELLARARGPLSARAAGTARNWATVTKLLALCD